MANEIAITNNEAPYYNPSNFYHLRPAALMGETIDDVVRTIQENALQNYRETIQQMPVLNKEASKFQQALLGRIKNFDEITKAGAMNIALHTYAEHDFKKTHEKLSGSQTPDLIKNIITDKENSNPSIEESDSRVIDEDSHQSRMQSYRKRVLNEGHKKTKFWQESIDELDELNTQMKEMIEPTPAIKPSFFARCKKAVCNIFSTQKAPIFGLKTKLNESILQAKIDETSKTFTLLSKTQAYKDAEKANHIMNGNLIRASELDSLCTKSTKELDHLLKCAKLLKMPWAASVQDIEKLKQLLRNANQKSHKLDLMPDDILQKNYTLDTDVPRLHANVSIISTGDKITIHPGVEKQNFVPKFITQIQNLCNSIELNREDLLDSLYLVANQHMANAACRIANDIDKSDNHLWSGTEDFTDTIEYIKNKRNEILWKKTFSLTLWDTRTLADVPGEKTLCVVWSKISQNQQGIWKIDEPISCRFGKDEQSLSIDVNLDNDDDSGSNSDSLRSMINSDTDSDTQEVPNDNGEVPNDNRELATVAQLREVTVAT